MLSELLIQNVFLGKVLVTTGIPYDSSVKTEVVDLANNAKCESLPNFPYEAFSATGGLIGQTPVICGGSRWNNGVPDSYDQCFTLGPNGYEETFALKHPRLMYATVPWNSTHLWLTGTDVNGVAEETEFLDLEHGITEGPTLPKRLSGHCMVKINDEKFMMIGGIDFANDHVARDTFIYDAVNDTWTQGPSLNNARFNPVCATYTKFCNHEEKYVVVAGGFINRRNDLTVSTEVYDYVSNTWRQGPDLPLEMEGFNMVNTPDNNGVIIYGGLYRDGQSVLGLVEKFYRFICSVDDCTWLEMEQRLEVKRSYPTGILVPDDLVKCE